jgi:hypothetical protein
MDLMDLILKQKIIVLSIGLAILILMAAAMVIVVPRIRRFLRLLAETKAQMPALEERGQIPQQDYRDEYQYDLTNRSPMRPTAQELPAAQPTGVNADVTPIQTTSGRTQPAQSADGPVQVNKVEAANIREEKKPAGTKNEEKPSGETVSSAMQDILSSVFTDDEALARYETLLDGTEKIDASELAVFCQQISDQLRSRVTA